MLQCIEEDPGAPASTLLQPDVVCREHPKSVQPKCKIKVDVVWCWHTTESQESKSQPGSKRYCQGVIRLPSLQLSKMGASVHVQTSKMRVTQALAEVSEETYRYVPVSQISLYLRCISLDSRICCMDASISPFLEEAFRPARRSHLAMKVLE